MTGAEINKLLIPNVSKLPKHKSVDLTGKLEEHAKAGEFQKVLDKQINPHQVLGHGIKLSLHAAKRLQERNLEMDNNEFLKLRGAMDKLMEKGGRDSLIITSNAAYIVDVGKNTIVTAIDKDNIGENVFTKIDSTLVVN